MNKLSTRWLNSKAHRQASWFGKLLSKCGKSNPISYLLRPFLNHPRLRFGLGAMILVLVMMVSAGKNEVIYGKSDIGGGTEIVLGSGEPNLKTVEAIRLPLEKIDISQRFWALHSGMDFRAPIGTPIWPIMPGRVIKADTQYSGYGNLVVIQHDNGHQTWYAHLSKIRVKVGDRVDTDTVIGDVGSTGRSTGPHLHLELREDTGRIVNPAPVLGL